MQQELTQKQRQFLRFLEQEIDANGYLPSLREAAQRLNISHAAVAQFIKTLEKKGYLRREGKYSRNIALLNRVNRPAGRHRWREVPIIGRVTAGLPIYAQQEWEGSVIVDSEIYKGANLFALIVKGDSMVKAGIMPGDLAICEPRQYAHNGEIVVVLLHFEEATIKRFFLRDDCIELYPENDHYQPVRYEFSEVMVQGKVVGVQRGPDQLP